MTGKSNSWLKRLQAIPWLSASRIVALMLILTGILSVTASVLVEMTGFISTSIGFGYHQVILIVTGVFCVLVGILQFSGKLSGFDLSLRHLKVGLLVISVIGLLVRFLPENSIPTAAVKVLAPTFVLGILPGILLVLAFKPLPQLSFLELLALGCAISLGLIQPVTIISLGFHIPISLLAIVIGAAVTCAAGALLLWQHPGNDQVLHINTEEVWIIFLVFYVALILYIRGVPELTATTAYEVGEHGIHISVIRRLAYLPNPSIWNFFSSSQAVYTHVLPGTHVFMAMVSRLGEINPTFVYYTLRAYFGLAALLLLYTATRLIFDSKAAWVAVAAGVIFALNGNFAHFVPNIYMAQLIPFSHPSDVAMNVLLPALLVLTLYYFQSEEKREQIFFLIATILLIVMLSMVHAREVIQYLVYLGSFVLALLIFRREKTYLKKSFILIPVAAASILIYALWYRTIAVEVNSLVGRYRTDLIGELRQFSFIEFFNPPYLAQTEYSLLFLYWFPTILFVSPIVLFVFNKRTLSLLMGSSILVYLLIFRFPILTMPYMIASYFEILYTIPRNLSFFVYILTGAFFYLVALNLARIKNNTVATITTIATTLVIGLGYSTVGPALEQHPDWFFIPLILIYLIVFGLILSGKADEWVDSLTPSISPRRWAPILALLILPLAAWTFAQDSSPMLKGSKIALTPQELELNLFTPDCTSLPNTMPHLTSKLVFPTADDPLCPPNPEVIAWLREALPIDAVLLTDTFNFPMPIYIPQQVVGWPIHQSWNIDISVAFPEYTEELLQKINSDGVQPFYNSQETMDERIEFLKRYNVTYVIVSPLYHDKMLPILAERPDVFELAYDDGEWAVYQIDSALISEEPGT